MNLKLQSDGTKKGTLVTDEDGNEVDNVVYVEYTYDRKNDVLKLRVDIEQPCLEDTRERCVL